MRFRDTISPLISGFRRRHRPSAIGAILTESGLTILLEDSSSYIKEE